MVNKVHRMKLGVVEVEIALANDPRATSTGGLAIAHGLGKHLRLWSDARRELPERKDPSQGFETEGLVASLVRGLLAGGFGFSTTEQMGGDRPLLKGFGLEQAPSAERR